MQFKHILFPTDFSELSKTAEVHVRSMAEHFGSRVTVMHCIEIPTSYYGVAGDFYSETADVRDYQNQAAGKKLAATLDGLEVERLVKIGDPAAHIIAYAEANGVDLIMMPTHGYGPFRRALLGSVTAKVLHDAQCPVWTGVHMPCCGENEKPAIRTIVCAIDLSPSSADELRQTGELAKSFGAKVYAAHAVTQVHFRHEHRGEPDRLAEDLQRYYDDHARSQIARMQELAGTAFPLCLMSGPVATVMGEVATRHNADLLVVGRGEIKHFLGTIRSHAYPIITEVPCPVLSV